jgi:hypothetical protein
VTFFTISENPWAIAGGTPAAWAESPNGSRLSMKAITKRHKKDLLHFAMTGFLQKVRLGCHVIELNKLFYTIRSDAFKD